MSKRILNILKEAVIYTEEARDNIKKEIALDPKTQANYLRALEQALTNLEFVKGYYSLAEHLKEHPEDKGKIIDLRKNPN